MVEPNTRPGSSERSGGFAEELRLFLSSCSSYLQARLELAGIESKEAALHYVKALAWAALACFGLLFGYVFFVIGIIMVTAHFAGWPLMWVVLGGAFLHFLVALAGALLAKGAFGVPQFRATFEEFRKDRHWLSRDE